MVHGRYDGILFPTSNYVQNANDYNDDIDTVNPNADEICDGVIMIVMTFDDMDEDVLDDNKIQIFLDSDNDGYGDDSTLLGCLCKRVCLRGDCDETDILIHPNNF